jgi:hypothetical protein
MKKNDKVSNTVVVEAPNLVVIEGEKLTINDDGSVTLRHRKKHSQRMIETTFLRGKFICAEEHDDKEETPASVTILQPKVVSRFSGFIEINEFGQMVLANNYGVKFIFNPDYVKHIASEGLNRHKSEKKNIDNDEDRSQKKRKNVDDNDDDDEDWNI